MSFLAGDYAQLLGLYLGDGHISKVGRTKKLRIFRDSNYPVIVADTRALLTRSQTGRPGSPGSSPTRVTLRVCITAAT